MDAVWSGSNAASSDVVVIEDEAPRRRQRAKPVSSTPIFDQRGKLMMMLIIGDGAGSSWHSDCSEGAGLQVLAAARSRSHLPDIADTQFPVYPVLAGVALVNSWAFFNPEADSPSERHLVHERLQAGHRTRAVGFVDYLVSDFARATSVINLNTVDIGSDGAWERLLTSPVCCSFMTSKGIISGKELWDMWQPQVVTDGCMRIWHPVADLVVRGEWSLIGSTFVTLRPRLRDYLFPQLLPRARLVAYIKHMNQSTQPDLVCSAGPSRISQAKKPLAPVQPRGCVKETYSSHTVMRFLEHAQYLRDATKQQDSLDAGLRAQFPDEWESLKLQAVEPPGVFCIKRARVRLEITCMLLKRFDYEAAARSFLYHTLGYDASPQKGLETFAVHEETCTDIDNFDIEGELLNLTCLGSGHQALPDKVMRVLWVLWLRAGPSLQMVRLFLYRTRILVSDMGVESGIADAPDYLHIFCAWLDNKPWPELDK